MPSLQDEWMDEEGSHRGQWETRSPGKWEDVNVGRCYEKNKHFTNNTQEDRWLEWSEVGTGQGMVIQRSGQRGAERGTKLS